MSEALYPRFSADEYDRRFRKLRAAMEGHGLDALVVFGWSALGRALQADVHYLATYLGMRDNYVVFPLEGEPVLFVQSYNHVPNAAEVSNLDDVRWGGTDSGRTLGEELVQRGTRSVGVVGMMPYQHHERMSAVAEGVSFRDVTSIYRRIRLGKSAEELEWLRLGAAHTDAALEALALQLRPGIREYELAEVIEHAYLSKGGLTTFYYLASTPMSSPDRCVPAQVLSSRILEPGDVVSCEISVSHGGYAGQGLRTFTVAADPTPMIADLHRVAEEVYWAVRGAIRPGATHEDVWAASDLIDDSGYAIRDGLVHGFGIGLLPPSIRTRQTAHHDAPWVFEEGQTIVIQPNVVSLDETAGVQTGDLCVVTANGCESLHRLPLDLIRTG
ncbi:MAG TPA: M24 family metallopeptidase [Acidimicrobiia bacterium]|nr:M24 family metallopeptidase [Acidimicrobiia bacterium]